MTAELASALDLVEARLQGVREAISREICDVPPPIPACDANVNRLLADRAQVVDALQRLARMRTEGVEPGRLVHFIETAAGLDDETRARAATLLSSTTTA